MGLPVYGEALMWLILGLQLEPTQPKSVETHTG